jgi:Ca-activated chloride channel family protein
MSFIWPTMLLLLLAVPLLVLLYLRMQRRRQSLAARYGSMGLMQGAAGAALSSSKGRELGWRRHLPPALFLCGLTILLLAIARPQSVVSLPRVEGTVILAFDVSGSMAADDMKPSRMEAAKTAARAFVERQPATVQVGVVSFSDSGFAVQVPTNDKEAVLASINRLAPARGTSLGNGLLVSLNTILASSAGPVRRMYSNLTPVPTPTAAPLPEGEYTNAVIVLLSDGENNESPDPLTAAQVAADRGVRIHTVGIGSPEGAIIHVDGFAIQTQLNEPMLQQISEMSGGTYYNAEDEEQLIDIYDHLTPELVMKPEKIEVTSVFAGASILVLCIAGIFSLLWLNRLP